MGHKGGSQEGGIASAVWQPMTALKSNLTSFGSKASASPMVALLSIVPS